MNTLAHQVCCFTIISRVRALCWKRSVLKLPCFLLLQAKLAAQNPRKICIAMETIAPRDSKMASLYSSVWTIFGEVESMS